MRTNPYPDDPAGMPTGQAGGPPAMEELQLKTVMNTPPVNAAGEEVVRPDEAAEVVEPREEARTVKFAIGKLNDFLQWFVVVLEIMLLIRFVLKLIGANPANMFAAFLYALTDIILYPFLNLVSSPSLHQNQAFEWATLIAMIIYWLVFYAIRRFLQILISEPEPSSE
jgi:hypothetical protein